MVNIRLFNAALARAGLNYTKLAQKMHCSPNTITFKVSGKGAFTTKEIVSICDIAKIEDNNEKCQIFLI